MIVALAAQKGGVGRTSTAIALACEWQRKKRKTLVVDCDPQRSALTWSEVAAERHHEAPTVVAMASGLSKPGQLPELASGYHAVVLDCPPRRDDLVREVLMLANLALLPCGPG